MCGRYALFADEEDLIERYSLMSSIEKKYTPSYNIYPSSYNPVITRNSPNKLEFMKWGLIPNWAKDPKIGFRMINARDDTITKKPSFKKPFLTQRCLIPFSGFFEWQQSQDKKQKTPFFIHNLQNKIMSFAGIYDVWIDAEGNETKSYTIITTKPNKTVQQIHDRMPVILNECDEDLWLSKDSNPEQLLRLLKPLDEDELEAYQISTKVNNPKNDFPEIIEEAE